MMMSRVKNSTMAIVSMVLLVLVNWLGLVDVAISTKLRTAAAFVLKMTVTIPLRSMNRSNDGD